MTNASRRLAGLLALLAVLLAAGCGLTKRVPDDAIAVVGKEAITQADVTSMIEGMDLDPGDPQLRAQVINQWVDRQILLHEARRRGLFRDKKIKDRIEELRQELIINQLYDDAIRVDPPTDEEVVAYWQDHTGEFTRVTDEVQMIICYTPSRNTAWAVRNGLDQSRSDVELRASYKDVDFDTTGFISVDRLPRSVSRAIDPLRTGQASLPFQLESRWLVVKLLARERAGRTRPLDEMMPVIRAQLHAEERARQRLQFISGLRREARRRGTVRIISPSTLEIEHQAVPGEMDTGDKTNPGKTNAEPDGQPADTFDASGHVTEPSGAVPGADLLKEDDQ